MFLVVALLQLLPLQPLISLLKLKSHQVSNVISHKKNLQKFVLDCLLYVWSGSAKANETVVKGYFKASLGV